jgi:hypothetical protein
VRYECRVVGEREKKRKEGGEKKRGRRERLKRIERI